MNFSRMLKNLFKKKKTVPNQDLLIKSLEGVGDILVFETEKQKNKLVIEALEKLNGFVDKIFEMQLKDPGRFDKLILSKDFFETYEKNQEDAKFLLHFNPEKYLISFSTAINQIIRVYEAAIKSKNDEISRHSVIYINRILASLSTQENNNLFIEEILRKLLKITRTAIRNNSISIYAAAIDWYTDIVFGGLVKENQFKISYLDLFNKYFFANIQYIISRNKRSIFNAIVAALIERIHIPDYHKGKVWDYSNAFMSADLQRYNKINQDNDISKQVVELTDSESDIATKEELNL